VQTFSLFCPTKTVSKNEKMLKKNYAPHLEQQSLYQYIKRIIENRLCAAFAFELWLRLTKKTKLYFACTAPK